MSASRPQRPVPRAGRPGTRVSPSQVLLVIGLVVAAAAAFGVLSSLLGNPRRITVTVENPTAYSVHVQVRAEPSGPVTRLGEVPRGTTRRFSSVLDQGDDWYVEFRFGGIDAGSTRISRDALDTGRPVVVPPEVARSLADAGIPPSPT